jgi:tetratricopeptide (TPR) repeat protein
MGSRRAILAPLAGALALLPLLLLATSSMQARTGLERPYDVRYVPDGKVLRLALPTFRLLLADLYWLSAVQYMGESKARQRGFEKLLPLAELITDLDPRHGYAYQTAGIALSSEGYLDESDAILKKGIESGPGWWTYPHYLAFNSFFYRGDYVAAAKWERLAASSPGASTNISHLALSLETKSGRPEEAVEFLRSLRDQVHDEKTASALEEQLKLALLQRDFRILDTAVERFRSEQKRAPASLDELVTTGLVPELPREPFGGTYRYDSADGKVHSTAHDFRFSAPERAHPLQRRTP